MRKTTILTAILAVTLTAAMTMPATAAGQRYDVMPDSYTFEAEDAGTYIFDFRDGENTSSAQGNEQRSDTTASAPVTATPSQIDLNAYADEIFKLVNEERLRSGLSEVERRTDVDEIAAIRAKELAEYFSHTRPTGEKYTTLADEYGIQYKYIGENAGTVAATAAAKTMMNGWMNSEGHKNNILNPKHTGLGIGVYKIGQKIYCSQMFIY